MPWIHVSWLARNWEHQQLTISYPWSTAQIHAPTNRRHLSPLGHVHYSYQLFLPTDHEILGTHSYNKSWQSAKCQKWSSLVIASTEVVWLHLTYDLWCNSLMLEYRAPTITDCTYNLRLQGFPLKTFTASIFSESPSQDNFINGFPSEKITMQASGLDARKYSKKDIKSTGAFRTTNAIMGDWLELN